MNIQVSTNFRKMSVKAILSICLFVLVYIVIVLLAIALTIGCVMFGLSLIAAAPNTITFVLAVGLSSLGFFILIFLFKFLFKKHKIDRSHFTEITSADEPELFQFIGEIVKEVDTQFPKKVYLSADVNASVFYDSSFWSMFFPVKKNLQIGIGLVNTVTKAELKAILGHEFGHFSQSSMKVGSYVYNVNQVIFNMLFENEAFDQMVSAWARFTGYFSIFIVAAVKIINGIQWVLKKMYEIINISYLALSREMEFHADEVAANVAGAAPLKDSLLRLELTGFSFNSVLGFYDNKISEGQISRNVFKEQTFVMNFLAKESELSYKNHLPSVSIFDLNKYNKSKLNIKDQWASHPSTEERINALEKLKLHAREEAEKPASILFKNFEDTASKLTAQLFSRVTYQVPTNYLDEEAFCKEYANNFVENSFDKRYHGYYDNKNPFEFDKNLSEAMNEGHNFETLFSKEKTEMVYDYIALENDKNMLTSIAKKEFTPKSFDYDGKKYKPKAAETLIEQLSGQITALRDKITKHDAAIYRFFFNEAQKTGNATIYETMYEGFMKFDKDYESKFEFINGLVNDTGFINVVTPFETITSNFIAMSDKELQLKADLRALMKIESLSKVITKPLKDDMEKYLDRELVYFKDGNYLNDNLQLLSAAINGYRYLISRNYFLQKQNLLNYQIGLLS